MNMPLNSLDSHLKKVHTFVNFLLSSGLKIEDLGITYSTLMGHYLSDISDINIVIYGKNNFWKLMNFFKDAKHSLLRWKTDEEWMNFYHQRNRYSIFDPNQFLKKMKRKKTEGFFDNTLFVIFAVEEENEVWSKWGSEKYDQIGPTIIEGTVTNNFDSIVRPGCYEIKDSKIIEGNTDVAVKKIVFYSRDYCMLAQPGEKLKASGILEKVETENGLSYHRLVVGYFDAYITERREKEFITPI